jgi:hypothetical protein
VRIAGALYPAVMLVVIVATGNHFFFDAAAGGIVVGIGYLAARLVSTRESDSGPDTVLTSAAARLDARRSRSDEDELPLAA